MVNTVEKEVIVLNKSIHGIVTFTDNGIIATAVGGDKSHIGAVSIVDEEGNLSTTTFPKHKETIIAETWAKAFYDKYLQPVTVSAGIHYDGITKEGIMQVVDACDKLLNELLLCDF